MTTVAEMTVEQFEVMIRGLFNNAFSSRDYATAEEEAARSKLIFQDIQGLIQASTPFRISSLAEWDTFTSEVRKMISDPKTSLRFAVAVAVVRDTPAGAPEYNPIPDLTL